MSVLSIRNLQSPDIPQGLGFPLLSTLLTLLLGLEKKSGIILSDTFAVAKTSYEFAY